MINGIRHVTNEDTISTRAYRLLHSMLRDDGVHCYEEWELLQLDAVLSEVANLTKLRFRHCSKERVAKEIEGFRFAKRAAVCDIGHGDHSILLTGNKGDWFSAFDPWQYEPGRQDILGKLGFPEDDTATNVLIHKRHLLGNGRGNGYWSGKEYQMGKVAMRFLTVIEKP